MVEPLRHRQTKEAANGYVQPTATASHLDSTIHVALVASVNRPHVRFESESDRIAAQQQNDAQCQEATYAPQQTSVYSITSSARASRVGGTSRPRALAVLRFITISYLVGACTGKSAGMLPCKMRSTYPAARRY